MVVANNIQEYHCVDALQRPLLPFFCHGKDFARDPARYRDWDFQAIYSDMCSRAFMPFAHMDRIFSSISWLMLFWFFFGSRSSSAPFGPEDGDDRFPIAGVQLFVSYAHSGCFLFLCSCSCTCRSPAPRSAPRPAYPP